MRSIVLGDTHLHHGTEAGASRDLLRLVEALQADGPLDIVLSGDIYDLALAGDAPVAERLARIIADQPSFHQALRRVIEAGGDVAIIPGNHDYELLLPEGREAFERLVEGARVQPWFLQLYGHTHVEHGNMYDPDNAHVHPLVPAGDPLGIFLTRRIMAPLGDLRLLDSNGKTPLALLWKSFVEYGLRTPELVVRYLVVGYQRVLGPKPQPAAAAVDAAEAGFPEDHTMTQKLRQLHPSPTHMDARVLFSRMYLARILAGIAGLGALLSSLVLWPALLPWIAGSCVLGWSAIALFAGNKYGGRVDALLDAAAHEVARLLDVDHVVLGHAHSVVERGPYLNTGSFAFPGERGLRPFVEVDRYGARHRFMDCRKDGFSTVEHLIVPPLASDQGHRANSALYAYANRRLGRTRRAAVHADPPRSAKRRPKR